MNPREKLLAGIIAVILGFFALKWFVDAKIREPLRQKDNELAGLNAKLDLVNAELRRAKDAEFDINLWRSLALPAGESTAQTIYQQYLEGLLRTAGIQRPSISPPQPRRIGADNAMRHHFVVSARLTDLKQLSNFLVGFYRTDCLHQIRLLDIKPEVDRERIKEYAVTIGIDAVSMKDAEAKIDMPKPKHPSYRNGFAERRPEEFAFFASKNPFQPTRIVAQNVARIEPRRTEERDERGNYVMTGVVISDGTPQLWLTDKANNKKMFLAKGDDVKIPGFVGKLIDIADNEAILEVANEIGVVRLGRSLATWTKLPQTALAEPVH